MTPALAFRSGAIDSSGTEVAVAAAVSAAGLREAHPVPGDARRGTA